MQTELFDLSIVMYYSFSITNRSYHTAQGTLLNAHVAGSLVGRGVWDRMNICVCMAVESLYRKPETITMLLTAILQYKI